MLILRLLIGFALIAFGFVIVWKTRAFIDTFGHIDWADQKLGGGGTQIMYKVIGIFLIFIGFLWAFNLWNAFLQATLGSILPTGTSQ